MSASYKFLEPLLHPDSGPIFCSIPCNLSSHLSLSLQDLIRLMLIIDPANRATIPDILNHKWMRRTVSVGFGLGVALMGSGVSLNPDFSSSAASSITPLSVMSSTVSVATAISTRNEQKSKDDIKERVKVMDGDKIDAGLKISSIDDRPYFRPSAVRREEVPSLRLPLTDKKDRHTLRSLSLNRDDGHYLRLPSGDKGERPSFRLSATVKTDYLSDSAFSDVGGATISSCDNGKEMLRSSSNSIVKQLSTTISDYNLGSFFTADGEPIVRAVVCGDTGPSTEATSASSTAQSSCQSVIKTQRGSTQSPVTGDSLSTLSLHTDSTVISRLTTPSLTPRLPSDNYQSHGDSRRSSNYQAPGYISTTFAGNVLSQPLSDPLSHTLTNILEGFSERQFQVSQSPTLPLGFTTDLVQSPGIASACVSVPVLAQVPTVEIMTSVIDDQSPILIPISPILIETQRSADGSVREVLTPTPVSEDLHKNS